MTVGDPFELTATPAAVVMRMSAVVVPSPPPGARYDEAERHLREAVSEGARVHGEDAPELAEYLNALAVCRRFAARYDEAAEVYAQAAELRDRAGLAQPPTHFHNLSGLASARGDYAAAEIHARAAIALRREAGGNGFDLATDLCGLGDALAGLLRDLEAEAVYGEALALFAASARPQHPEVAFAHHNRGDALAALGRSALAEAAYRQAIDLKTAALGRDHHETAATLNNLAALLNDLGRGAQPSARAHQASLLSITRPRPGTAFTESSPMPALSPFAAGTVTTDDRSGAAAPSSVDQQAAPVPPV